MDDVEEFAQALLNAKKTVHYCRCCENLTDQELCSVCEDDTRDRSLICVVETPKDIAAFERTGEYRGTYHVLHGLISPMSGVTPEHIKLKELIASIGEDEGIREVIIATNATIEGDATALYISRLLQPLGIQVTRLAYGIPVGADLEYADEVTLYRALEGRRNVE